MCIDVLATDGRMERETFLCGEVRVEMVETVLGLSASAKPHHSSFCPRASVANSMRTHGGGLNTRGWEKLAIFD